MGLKCSDKFRENAGALTMMLMVLSTIMTPLFISDSFSTVVIIGTGLFSLLGLTYLNIDHLKDSKYKLRYLVPLLVFGGSFIINGLHFKVLGYIVIGIIFCIIIPIVQRFMVTINIDTASYSIAKGIFYFFVLFYILSVLFGPPLADKQYFSFLPNPNIVGGIASIVVASILYLLLCNKTKHILVYYFVLGLALSMCFFSNSRTNMLAIIIQIFIVVLIKAVWLIKHFNKCNFICYAKKIATIAIIIVLSFMFFFYSVTSINVKVNELLTFEIFDFDNNQEGIDLEESLAISGERYGKGLDEKDSFAFTSGRTAIWNAYLERVSIIGHSSESMDIDIGTRLMKNTNAHNVYLQVAYSAGILAGVAIFLYIAIMGLELFAMGVKHIFRGDVLSNSTIYLILAYFSFSIASLTSAGYMIFTYLPATLFWTLTYIISFKKD